MRRVILLTLAILACSPLLPSQTATLQGTPAKVDDLLPFQQAFTNLSLEKRTEFVQLQREAGRLFSEKRIFEALEVLVVAEKIFDQSPELINLRGSCYVELRAMDKAQACFKKALELTPNNHSILFNVGEIYFVTQEWEKAHEIFSNLVKELGDKRRELSRISEFKMMLCKLKLDQKAEAEILANKYDYLDDSPYHYFAKAALAYEADELAEAEQWIARAARIFQNPAVLAPWHDTLVEYGYIKSFYGGKGQ